MPNKFVKYLREDRLPHIYCTGCGNGSVMNAFLEAMEKTDIDFENLALVSGIGCSSRIPGYVNCDSLHTTHGRSLSFATGLKVSNPNLDVVLFSGDGDCASIGGNHLIHAARRNIDLTMICINNNIYGMTGGQISPTSPKGSFGSTAPYGNDDVPFNLAELVATAGASYSARWTTYHIENVVSSIEKGLKNKGFSFIEVVSQCPTYYGRKNKQRTSTAMMVNLKINSVLKSKAENMTKKQLESKIVVGEFANNSRAEFTENINNLSKEKSGNDKVINSAFEI